MRTPPYDTQGTGRHWALKDRYYDIKHWWLTRSGHRVLDVFTLIGDGIHEVASAVGAYLHHLRDRYFGRRR